MNISGYWKGGDTQLAMRTFSNVLRKAGYSAGWGYAGKSARIQFYSQQVTGQIDLIRACGGRVTVHLVFHPSR
jgi:hypothetical protein